MKKLTKSLLVLFVFIACGKPTPEIKMPEKGICAHRGAMGTHPENTVAAFKEAVRLGAQMIELDVRFTRDKKLVILHDATVDRTTEGTGAVSELDFDYVRSLDAGSFKDLKFAGEKIPTLDEALQVMPQNIWLNLHLKGDSSLGSEVAKAVVRHNRLHQAFLACKTELAKAAKSVSPEIKICNMERQGDTEQYVNDTIEMQAEFIQLLRVEPGPLLENFAQILHEKNIIANYCCTDDPEAVKTLFDNGVDFILVNELHEIMPIAESIGIIPVVPVY